MNSDERYMRQALALAAKGGRAAAPNPMVGAVIVKNGRVIGRGYHQRFGGPHAEVNAIRSVRHAFDLTGATLYVTLEPCRHYGKTPPCAEAVAQAGIARVVCGARDPFQRRYQSRKVSYSTVFLKGAVARDCKALNKFFFMWATEKRPFVTVKVAMSADGFVAGEGGQRVHFTSPTQDKQAHRLRAAHQAIVVGIGTVFADDPALTVRYVSGADPLRVILDSRLRIPRGAQALRDGNHLVATVEPLAPRGLHVWRSPTQKQVSLKHLLRHLAARGVASVLVEPGPTLYAALKQQKLIDELIVFKGKKRLGKGLRLTL